MLDTISQPVPVMPPKARPDAPGTMHHVMVRGLERRLIFRDDPDRADFVTRLAALVPRLTGVDFTRCPVCRTGRLHLATRQPHGG